MNSAYSPTRVSGYRGCAPAANIHGDPARSMNRSRWVDQSINRLRLAAQAVFQSVFGSRADPNRSWEDRSEPRLRFTVSHLLHRGTSTYWLTVGLRGKPSLSQGFHQTRVSPPRIRDNSEEESRLRLTLLIPWIDFAITRNTKKCRSDRDRCFPPRGKLWAMLNSSRETRSRAIQGRGTT